MASFDQAILRAEEEIREAQSKMDMMTSQIETAHTKLATGEDINVDIENATLDDVHAHAELMNANIADLIMGLDDVTAGFSEDFDAMREKTAWESFVGIFSSGKSDSMREERMRSASVDDKLQDLIGKSDTIVALLKSQLDTLNTHKERVDGNLQETLTEREATVAGLEQLRADILAMDPKLIELENKISVEQDAAARTRLESELSALNTQYNEMVQDEQVKVAHEDHMIFARKVLEEKAKSDERFARRFAKIVEKHDKNLYGSS